MNPVSTKNSMNTDESLLLPFLFPAKDKAQQAWMTQMLKQGKIRSIGPRLYTSLPESKIQEAVRSCWSDIISHLFPKAVLSHRSALEYRPTPEGIIYLTGATNRRLHYPGLTVEFSRGPSQLPDDPPFLQFHVSSLPRALLENLSATQRTVNRCLATPELEKKLEDILQVKGEADLNRLRDRARILAKELGWKAEFKKLDSIIGALLGTRPARGLRSSEAKARSRGRPYDSTRMEKFDLLLKELQTPLPELKEQVHSSDHFRNKAFFESYFSNYIEGTTFEIEEAEEIVFQKIIPKDRPKDGHDVLGTFEIVANPAAMKETPESLEELEALIKKRHFALMQSRPEVFPGAYKTKPNRAGNTEFVSPNLVQGTLEQGFERYITLPKGLARAAFILFLISEVHPFTDGNGRIARIMMNAELFSQGLSTIIIPTVFREDYLLSLRALTRRNRPGPLTQMLVRSQKFSQGNFQNYPDTLKQLKNRNWFLESDEGKLID